MSKTKTKKKIKKRKENGKNYRKINAGLFISLDGVTESPNKWQDTFDDEMGVELQKTLDDQDSILLGRKTYEEWSHYWPTNTEDPFAQYINNIHKYVVSSTLDKVEWGKYDTISLIKDLSGVKELKSMKGKNIGMSGSSSLVLSLLEADLLDELILMIHPVVVGKGKQLFQEISNLKRLKLQYSKSTSSGVIIAKYSTLRD